MPTYRIQTLRYQDQTFTIDAVDVEDGAEATFVLDPQDLTHPSAIAHAAAGLLELAIERIHDLERSSKL
ncbi:hypothetical protein [Dactylosporangium sp. NPDC048998]|uniref:hypothetical protein n=1 Tax=Dactylosporangium sp. NPDC048998 TaxID=3363976 RepID=UPI0037190F29